MSLDFHLYDCIKCDCGKLHQGSCWFSRNITHNLGAMAKAAGIYEALWRPEEISATQAKHIIEPLQVGLNKLRSEPDYFSAFNPSNGWGTYDDFVRFVHDVLDACVQDPEAMIGVSV